MSSDEVLMPSTTGQAESPAVDLSIIIPTYNGRDLLADCLESIFEHPPSRPYEVIVVDDASSDHTSQMVSERFPDVCLLRNEKNVHYGKSNNRALSIARGRYIYLLNNDTIMLPNAMDQMMAFLEANPDAGAVGSKLLNEDGSIQASVKSLPNPMSALFGARSILTKMFPKNRFTRQHLLHLDRDLEKPFTAGYVSSASVMIPAEVVRKVGGLDERLSYHVDADYCKRITNAGWRCYYFPDACVIHLDHKGGTMSSRRRRFLSVVEFHRGSYIYYRKHIMKNPWNPMHIVVLLGLGGRFVVSLVVQSCRELWIDVPERRQLQ